MIKKIRKMINRYGLNLTKSVTIDKPEIKEVEKVIKTDKITEEHKGRNIDIYV